MVQDSKEETGLEKRDSGGAKDQPISLRETQDTSADSGVHISPDLIGLTTGKAATDEEIHVVKERRDLDEVVHRMLIVGLLISTALILIGLALDIFFKRDVPTAVPDIADVFARVEALRPSGFLALGLLVLIATPIFRVIASIFVFIYERDWRYVVITIIVFLVVMISVLFGKG